MTDHDVLLAYHEAGHAAAAVVLGVPIESATLRCVVTQPAGRDCVCTRCHRGIIALAGPVAEDKHQGYSARERAQRWETTWSVDLDNIVRHLRIAHADSASIVRRAQQLVGENWDLIETLAAALLDQKELTGDEIGDLVKGAASDGSG